MLSVKDALGVLTSYAYDAMNRQRRVIEDNGDSLQRTTTTAYCLGFDMRRRPTN